MAPAISKRKRPSFSPPRSKAPKSVDGASTKSTKATGRPSTSKKQKHKQSRLISPTPSVSNSAAAAAAAEEGEDEDEEEDEEEAVQPSSPSPAPISEPDFILAEITRHDNTASDEPVIPLPLLHRILHHNFRDKDKTRITADAKEVVGKYVEVFVREAIARSVYESQGKGADGADDGMARDDGFVEVEDLEKTGIQLVLDF